MYAVIDLGSNSFHLLIARQNAARFELVDRCSEKIQLAEGLGASGALTPAAIRRGLDCLRLFRDILSRHPIQELRVVATQALRQASNARDFTGPAQELGLPVEIISGRREAELICRGVCDPLPDPARRRLVIDIGGASTEIAIGQDQNCVFATSLPMGCVSWRDRFFADALRYPERADEARAATREVLSEVASELKEVDWQESYASSGSAKMLSRIALAHGWNRGEIDRGVIRRTETAISQVARADELALRGLKPERRDLLAPGLVILSSIMECLAIDTVFYSSTALREGLLGEMAGCRVRYSPQYAAISGAALRATL